MVPRHKVKTIWAQLSTEKRRVLKSKIVCSRQLVLQKIFSSQYWPTSWGVGVSTTRTAHIALNPSSHKKRAFLF